MAASRDAVTLNILYPAGAKFIRLKVTRRDQVIGWAVVLDTQMRSSKYFGNLRVGSIVDCFAEPENARAVIQAAAACLDERGVDLVACNHAHGAWTDALSGSGFLRGPSNFIYGASKPLRELTTSVAVARGEPYLMRGDGDGPVNL
jgi:hypothetical protein